MYLGELRMKSNNIILQKSYSFALKIVQLYVQLKNEFILSKQLLKSGTSIGTNCEEGSSAQSKKRFYCQIFDCFKRIKGNSQLAEVTKRQ